MATAYLIHGYLCVGKTTIAKQLEREHDAVRFSIDQWMIALYGNDPPEEPWTRALFDERFGYVQELLDDLWPRLLRSGTDVVLDFGFWTRVDRDEARVRATTSGAEAHLIHVRCAERVARERCRRRNRNPRRSFPIDDEVFESLRSRFEQLGSDEAFELVETDA